jgi:hypothetical protein
LLALSCLLAQTFSIKANPSLPSEFSRNDVTTAAEASWTQFRNTFPYHIQTLAFDKKSRTVVISEPPSHVTLANLKEALQRYIPTLSPPMSVKSTGVGVDGWVKDIVLQLPPMDESETRDALDAIQQHVFYTNYKAYVMSLPVEKPAPSDDKLDLNVSIGEVQKWLFENREPLSSLFGGTEQTADQLLTSKKSGVFFSRRRGVVVWSINRSRKISDYLIEARQFALDSDLIVGAVSAGNLILIVGRERIIPVEVLPPLRTETIMLLASVRDDEIAQSYERNNIFAGKFNDREDWAPIYLSDPLIDTEYGSLLNITDQLLKRWSMNGLIEYKNFKYPNPQKWGKDWCFTKPLYVEAGAEDLTFNWNTQGVGYTTENGGRAFFGLNRSGSLPTSYLEGVDQKPTYSDYEEKGYQCFAKFGDPNLARVVQYAALYQIFQKFPLQQTSDVAQTTTSLDPSDDALTEEALRIIKIIVQPSLDQFAQINASLSPIGQAVFKQQRAIFEDMQSRYGDAGLRALAARIAHPQVSRPELNRAREIQQKIRSLPPAKRLSILNPSTAEDLILSSEVKDLIRWKVGLEAYEKFVANPTKLSHLPEVLFVRIGRTNLEELKNRYSAESQPRLNTWIHTPSIVISEPIGEFAGELVGGHNVRAATTDFKVSAEVPPRTIRTIRKGNRLTFLVNPEDAARIPSLIRRAAFLSEGVELTPTNEANIRQTLQASMNSAPPPPPPRSWNKALLMPDDLPGQPARARGFDGGEGNGWRPARTSIAVPDEVVPLTQHGEVAVLVDRHSTDQGFEYTITTGDGKAITAHSTPSAIDAVVSLGRNAARENPKVAFALKGFNEGEARGFLYNANLRFKNNSLTGFVKNGLEPTAYGRKAIEYDLPRATVSDEAFRLIPEGQYKGLYELTVDIDLPSQAVTKRPLRVRIQMFYRNSLSASTISGVKTAIKGFFVKPISAGSNVDAVIVDLAKELRTINGDAKSIMTIWEQDTSGIFILELRPKVNDGNLRENNNSD